MPRFTVTKLIAFILFISTTACGAMDIKLHGKTPSEVFRDPKVDALIKAVYAGDMDSAKQLIRDGTDINALGDFGMTPLLWAEFSLQPVAMQRLLDLGANPDLYGNQGPDRKRLAPPVMIAAGSGQLELLRILLEKKANPNIVAAGISPMTAAMRKGCLECAELLLKYGADVNLPEDDVTPFAAAAVNSRFDLTIWLLKHGYRKDLERNKRAITGLMHLHVSSEQASLRDETLRLIDEKLTKPN
jgi:ankyrin repeat protein